MAKSDDAFPVLLTPRLRLRRIDARDGRSLHACFGDPEAMRFWDLPPSSTMADTGRMLSWLAQITSPYDHLAWGIVDKATDQCMGMVCYHHREARNKRLELGYIVAPAYQRQGFAAEAVGVVPEHCVGMLGAHRVQALIHPENSPSIRPVERLGFRCEGGPLTDYWCVGGIYRSAMLYAFVARPNDAAAVKAQANEHRRGRSRKEGGRGEP